MLYIIHTIYYTYYITHTIYYTRYILYILYILFQPLVVLMNILYYIEMISRLGNYMYFNDV